MNSAHASIAGIGAPSAENAGLTFLRVASHVFRRVDQVLAPLDLTYSEYRALDRLRASGGRQLVESRNGRELVAADAVLRSLELKALVRLRADACGEGVRVELTPAGSAQALVAARELDAVAGDFGTSFGAGEALGLRELLTRVENRSRREPGRATWCRGEPNGPSGRRRSSEAEKDENRPLEAHHVLGIESADPRHNVLLRHGGDLVDHELARSAEPVSLGRLDLDSK
jgi:DNA-binding MarR family transcriptional regulator